MPIRYGKKRRNPLTAKTKMPFEKRNGILFKNSRVTTHAYEESVNHVKSFGAVIGKSRYLVLTYHDVLTQLLQRELFAKGDNRFSNFSLVKAETLFRKEVAIKPIYGHYKGEYVNVGYVCSKKKTRVWFRRNLNRMLSKK